MRKPKPWFCSNCRKVHPPHTLICPRQIDDRQIRAEDYDKTVMTPVRGRGRPKVNYTFDDAKRAMEEFMKTPFMQKRFPE